MPAVADRSAGIFRVCGDRDRDGDSWHTGCVIKPERLVMSASRGCPSGPTGEGHVGMAIPLHFAGIDAHRSCPVAEI